MKPTITLHHGDSRDILKQMKRRGEMVHSIVCDPPYHLDSIVKRFGGSDAAPAKFGRDGAFVRQSKGFMGRKWDGADENGTKIAQDPEFWRMAWEVLLPGGYVIAFSSSRTYGWMQVAMELAGFVTHPMIGWIQGQGFPKAHDASKAIDRQLGAERTVIGSVTRRDIRNGQGEARGANSISAAMRQDGPKYIEHELTEAATDAAADWEGWAYGLQTLKPSLEPIYVGQKPFSEKNGALNLLKYGVGAMNIDGCRVGEGGQWKWTSPRGGALKFGTGEARMVANRQDGVESANLKGRHPGNVLHDGSDIIAMCFPSTKSSRAGVMRKAVNEGAWYGAESRKPGTPMTGFGDEGSAARFFNALPFTSADELPFIYHPKATNAERIIGCTLCGRRALRDPGCDCRDPNDTSKPAKRISHPTVKPVLLKRWLQRLVTPVGGTTLDPFAGSGTSGAAAQAEGFHCVLIEKEDDHIADIRARLGLRKNDNDFADLLGTTPWSETDLTATSHSTDSGIFADLLG